jgi:hypothetical protein
MRCPYFYKYPLTHVPASKPNGIHWITKRKKKEKTYLYHTYSSAEPTFNCLYMLTYRYKHLEVYSLTPFPLYSLLPGPPTGVSKQLHAPAVTAESHVFFAIMDHNPSNCKQKKQNKTKQKKTSSLQLVTGMRNKQLLDFCQLDTDLDTPRKKEKQLMNCLPQTGLWPRLQGIFLIDN